MAKRTTDQLKRKADTLVEYKWEFMRRDPAYISDYRKRSKRLPRYWKEKYRINRPMDPSLPFSELKNIRTLLSSGFLSDLQPGQAVYFTGFRTSPFDARKTNNALIDEALVSDDHNLCGQIRMVQLMVNLEKDRDEIRDEFDRSISLWLRLTGIRKRTRARFNDFKVYLRVYDLKAQKELSVTKIAKKIYGAGKDDESTMRKVKRQLQDAKKLIEGGYRHLR